jgi:hypothetical protein
VAFLTTPLSAPQCGHSRTRLQRSSRRLNTPSRCTRSSLGLRNFLRQGGAGAACGVRSYGSGWGWVRPPRGALLAAGLWVATVQAARALG